MAREIYNIASSGLMLAQRALNTTSHNISNASVEGYSRQRLETSGIPDSIGNNLQPKSFTLGGYISRAHDAFIQSQIRTESAAAKASDIYHKMASSIDNFIADADTNLTAPMTDLFASMQDIVTDPNATAARIAMLDHAEVMTQRFGTLQDQFTTLHQQINYDLNANVDEINTLAQNIASLNTQIVGVYNDPNLPAPNDLLDQRDTLIKQLSEKMNTHVNVIDNGSLNVFIGYGQPLVSGSTYGRLELKSSEYNPDDKDIKLVMSDGQRIDITKTITGGKIGGMLSFNREVLDPSIDKLGQLAAGFSLAFNAQQKSGLDLNGGQGDNIFTDYTKLANNTDNWHPSQKNTNTATKWSVTFDDAVGSNNKLVASEYNLSYKEGSYTLTRLSDNITFPPSTDGTFNVDGLKIQLADGVPPPDEGDSYLLTPYAHVAADMKLLTKDPNKVAAAALGSGVADNTNMIALSKLQSDGTLNKGQDTFFKSYSEMVTWIGGRTRNAEMNTQAHETLLKQINDQRESISGVNLDEEAANMLQYQQAYQAAAQIIPVANSMFEALLSAVR